MSFGNITIELNIFNIAKQPRDRDEGSIDVDLIEELVYHSFPSNLSDDSLQKYLTYFGMNFDTDRSIDKVNVFPDSSPSVDTNK